MGKSIADIISEEFDKVFTPERVRQLQELMDNVNPSGLCLLCHAECGKGHLICTECYRREKSNESPARTNHDL